MVLSRDLSNFSGVSLNLRVTCFTKSPDPPGSAELKPYIGTLGCGIAGHTVDDINLALLWELWYTP